MQRIYRPADMAEASLLTAVLADHHIRSHISGGYLQGAIGDLPVHDLLGLWVEDEDVDRSTELIHAYLQASPINEEDSELPQP
ncbi:MAG: hypothetical protein CMK85_08285 [Pseudomonadales bacterium]|jgi:hypothetical protein|uniref:putative signal transducing protein n=1 Tax=Halopseudomonas TaxID=2901189 RepID=UPI000C517096|nr:MULTISPECIES: DUF2007 domain-containing protein [Halopseudomonas]MAD26915.1 hypothetical protein [Pseudomonadales bacterium]MEE2798528.1 DUF2007 domain-containing protein [Pseudomonadota bacterium]HCP05308.1 hypothetical protein [Pseudomonas sp.]MAH00960.1 hypothetical protein [Pseudomonadales bacterium]MAK73183.1 hypothetical protein [Pseudomonadales bacterium]|tara:strand:- start:13346 stop:13594 length:249 start_codon:yes stop_codon:yes gene_type:complete